MRVDTTRAGDLDALMAAMRERDAASATPSPGSTAWSAARRWAAAC